MGQEAWRHEARSAVVEAARRLRTYEPASPAFSGSPLPPWWAGTDSSEDPCCVVCLGEPLGPLQYGPDDRYDHRPDCPAVALDRALDRLDGTDVRGEDGAHGSTVLDT